MILSYFPLLVFLVLLIINDKYGVLALTFICIFIPSAVTIANLPVPTVALVLFFVYFFFKFLFLKGVRRNLSQFPLKRLVLFLFLALLLITVLNLFVGFGKLLVFIGDRFFLGLAIWVTLRKEQETSRFYRYLWMFFIIICSYGILSSLTNSNPYIEYVEQNFKDPSNSHLIFNYNEETFKNDNRTRGQSVFNHPIRYGGHLAMIAPFIIGLVFMSKKRRVYYLGVLGLLLISIILSNSRSGMLELVVSLVVLFFLLKPRDKLVTIFLVVGILVVGLWASPFFSDYSQTLLSTFQILGGGSSSAVGGSSVAMRLSQLATVFAEFVQSPYYGQGIGYTDSLVASNSVSGLYGAESFLFSVALDTGIIGLIAYATFFTLLIRYFLKLRKKPIYDKYSFLINATISMTAGYLVFIFATGELNTFYFFFFLIVLSLRTLTNESAANKAELLQTSDEMVKALN